MYAVWRFTAKRIKLTESSIDFDQKGKRHDLLDCFSFCWLVSDEAEQNVRKDEIWGDERRDMTRKELHLMSPSKERIKKCAIIMCVSTNQIELKRQPFVSRTPRKKNCKKKNAKKASTVSTNATLFFILLLMFYPENNAVVKVLLRNFHQRRKHLASPDILFSRESVLSYRILFCKNRSKCKCWEGVCERTWTSVMQENVSCWKGKEWRATSDIFFSQERQTNRRILTDVKYWTSRNRQEQ